MAFDEGGFSGMFDMMNPQGNPLELGSMLAHQPEGIIPQLAAEGITPAMFEQRFPEFMGGGLGQAPGLTSGQLLNTGFAGGIPVLSGPESAVGPPAIGPEPPLSRAVPTVSFQRPMAGPAQAPGVQAATQAPGAIATPAEVPPGYQDPNAAAASPAPGAAPPAAGANPAAPGMDAKAQADKKVADLVKLLSGVKAPAAPVVQQPRPGTAGPPAVRPINPQSAISALLQQALGGGRAAPSLSSVVRR